MSLDAHLVVSRGSFVLDVALEVEPGEVVALVGPNGAGKTTSLRALAGLTPLSSGYIRLSGQLLDGPPEERPIGVVFQDYLLFPHLSAQDNVAFGPRCRGVSKAESRRTAAAWLATVGLADEAHKRPRELSGGQAQRVALARALAVDPDLLLLDEPLAALDAHTRLTVRSSLRRHLADFAGVAVLVTHDPLDAMVLADRLVVIEGGRVVQTGTPTDVARHPRTPYVAQLVGLNLYRGTASGHTITLTPSPGHSLTPSPGPHLTPSPDSSLTPSPDSSLTSSPGSPFTPSPGSTFTPSPGSTFTPSPDSSLTSSPGSTFTPSPGSSLTPSPGFSPGPGSSGANASLLLSASETLEGDVFVAFPPAAVALFRSRPDGTPRNLWQATITSIERYGDSIRVHLTGPVDLAADITATALTSLALEEGQTVWAAVKATETHAYPA